MKRLVALAAAVASLAGCSLVGGIDAAEPQCQVDARRNGLEADIDCGGPCVRCADGKRCDVHEDCASNACFDHVCTPPECDDDRQNGLETDVDCGGLGDCARCWGDQRCSFDQDCASYHRASSMGVAACQAGFCIDAECYGDCEEPSTCASDCGMGLLGASCDPTNDASCEAPLQCLEDDQAVPRCF